jgi:hypothetical protein
MIDWFEPPMLRSQMFTSLRQIIRSSLIDKDPNHE